ncbi:hypothetical protein GOODEAATRI_004275, partial [Goodea atripinnis]
AIETALDCLKSANTEPYYRRQAWEVIKCFLVAMTSLDDNKHALYQLLSHPNDPSALPLTCGVLNTRKQIGDLPAEEDQGRENFTDKWIPSVIISHRYKAQDTPARRTFEQALTGAFMSAVIKDLRPSALPFVASLIRHYTMVALGSQPSTAMFHSEENGSKGMDPLVLIDAIAICMAYEEKELCKIGEVALAVIFDVASIILGSKERVSNGAVAMAKTTLEQLLVRCATPLKDEEKTEELLAAQDKSFHMVTHDLVREVTSPNSTVRKQAMHSLQVLAQVTGKSVTVIMEPHKEVEASTVLQDMVPPKKHLLRHQPANAQIGLMEGNTFCTTLQPRLFTMDLNVMEHKVFYTEFLEGATIEVDQIHTHMRPLLMMLGDYRSLTLNVVNRLTSVTRLFPNSFNDKFCDQMMEMKICSAIINLFHLIPAAPQTLVKPLLEVVMKTERAMLIERASDQVPDSPPIPDGGAIHDGGYPQRPSVEPNVHAIDGSRLIFSFLFLVYCVIVLCDGGLMICVHMQSFLKHKDAKPLRDVLASNPNRFVPLLVPAGTAVTVRPGSPSTTTARLDLQFQAIKVCSATFKVILHLDRRHHAFHVLLAPSVQIISIIVKNDEGWLAGQHSLVSQLRRVWVSEAFQERHRKDNMAATNWKEPKLLAYCLLSYCKRNYSEIELLFQLVRAFTGRFLCNMTFLKEYMEEDIPRNYSIPQKRALFFRFVEFNDPHFNDELKAKVLDPEKQADLLDSLRICLLQFSTLLVEHAPHHIHDNNKSRNSKLRRLMTFAWPCLLPKACVDPACKYSGHLLLAHIIAKFAIHKKIVLQVFHSLLKAHTMEARAIVRQAMAILTPAVPARMEDGHQMLTHWTRKIIVEEGHTVPQLVHILHLIVQHFRVSRSYLHRTPVCSQRSIHMINRTCWQDAEVLLSLRTLLALFGILTEIKAFFIQFVSFFMLKVSEGKVNDSTNVAGSPGELLSRRCVNLMKTALRPDMWPRAELKLQWFDKLLMTVEQPAQANISNICTGLEILCFLLTVLQSPAILAHFKPLQRGIAACMTCGNTKILRAVHSLLSRLMSIFPTEPSTSNVASKYEELECLYAAVGKVIYEGLTNYEKATSNTNPTQLFGTLMILKSACSYNASYIDRLISVFMRSLQKMVREHLSPQQANPGVTETSTALVQLIIPAVTLMGVTSELVMLSLDLVKTRLSVMSMEMRKNFIQVILTSLIEKSSDPKILRAVVKIVEEWVKNNSPMAANQMPNLREKSILLVKMMTYIEKRFPDELELNAQFLDLVNYVYRDESLSGSDITSKLEPAFLSGLRCTQPVIRAKFFEVFDASMKRRVYERLLYICCSQNWEAMGSHFWIKQCIELLLAVCERNTIIGTSCQGSMLPSITNVINLADSHDRAAFAMATHVKQEPRERENSETKEEDVEIDIELAPGDQTAIPKTKEQAERDTGNQLHMLTNRHDKFLDSLREVKTGALLNALVQLCHISTPLAERTWVQLFPRLWKILSDRQQHVSIAYCCMSCYPESSGRLDALSGEMSPFLCSGSHQAQRDCQPSALNCFVEAMSQCVPPIPIRPCVLKYLGKTHNLWLRSTLMLEQQAFEKGLSLHTKPKQSTEFYEQESITPPQQEILDSLAELYSLLQEEDMWAGLWQKRCKFPETTTAIAYEQHGFFEQVKKTDPLVCLNGINLGLDNSYS